MDASQVVIGSMLEECRNLSFMNKKQFEIWKNQKWREYEIDLRKLQDDFASRGLALSGMRNQAEKDLKEKYNNEIKIARLGIKKSGPHWQKWSVVVAIIGVIVIIVFFLYQQRPNLKIIENECGVYNNNCSFLIKNIGSDTAKDVDIRFNLYSFGFAGKSYNEIIPDKEYPVSFKLLYYLDQPQFLYENPDLLNDYEEILGNYQTGEKSIIFYVSIYHRWFGISFRSYYQGGIHNEGPNFPLRIIDEEEYYESNKTL